MPEVETVRVKHSNERGYKIINRSDFDPKVHTEIKGGEFQENSTVDPLGRNPSGTFSEPTPTDVRYPDKNATEFENNHGAFVGKSAAQMRQAAGLPNLPGGIYPDVDIPDDWKKLDISKKRELASKVGGNDKMAERELDPLLAAAVERKRLAEKSSKAGRPAAVDDAGASGTTAAATKPAAQQPVTPPPAPAGRTTAAGGAAPKPAPVANPAKP